MFFLCDFFQKGVVRSILRENGLSVEASRRISIQYKRVAQSMLDAGVPSSAEVEAYWVPGRLELLGKHTDYAGGASLLVAVERGFSVLVSRNEGNTVRFLDAASASMCTINKNGDVAGDAPHWSIYPLTAFRRIKSNFGGRGGGCIAFQSDLPEAAGMSSSSAFIIAACMALQTLWGIEIPFAHGTTALADYLGHVENGQTYNGLEGDLGVGTFGGSQDHTAILCSRPRCILYTRFMPTQAVEYIQIPAGHLFCIASSGVKAEKAAGQLAQYNHAAYRAGRILDVWNKTASVKLQTLSQLINAPLFDKQTFLAQLSAEPDDLNGRFEQFYNETARYIPGAIHAIKDLDFEQLGCLVDASQGDAERYLNNQIPETRFLTRSARALGAVAASAFGAGFGGSVWALVKTRNAETFLKAWEEAYVYQYPGRTEARFFPDQTGPAAFQLVTKAAGWQTSDGAKG